MGGGGGGHIEKNRGFLKVSKTLGDGRVYLLHLVHHLLAFFGKLVPKSRVPRLGGVLYLGRILPSLSRGVTAWITSFDPGCCLGCGLQQVRSKVPKSPVVKSGP